MVLFAVSRTAATSGPVRSTGIARSTTGSRLTRTHRLAAQLPAPRPGAILPSDLTMRYATSGRGAQRNGSPDRQTLCRITDSLRAKATRALPEPARRSIASAQSFSGSDRFTRWRITTAASYMSVRARPSPHLEMCPLRSVSPDWYRRGVRPRCAPTARDRVNRLGSSTVLTYISVNAE